MNCDLSVAGKRNPTGSAGRASDHSVIQLQVPVSVADELRPAFQPDRMASICRTPDRSAGPSPQWHGCLFRSPITFPMIAFHTCQYAIGPVRCASLSAGQDMINRQFFTARTTSTVLAHKCITFKDIATTEGDNIVWRLVVVRQRDNLRHPQSQPLRLDDGFVICRLQFGPFVPAMLQKTIGIDDAR